MNLNLNSRRGLTMIAIVATATGTLSSAAAQAVTPTVAAHTSTAQAAHHPYYPSCKSVKDKAHLNKGQVAKFRRQAKKFGYSKHAINVVVHCRAEKIVPTDWVLTSGAGQKLRPPKVNPLMATRNTAAGSNSFCPKGSKGWVEDPQSAYMENVTHSKMARFTFYTAVCFKWVYDANQGWWADITKEYTSVMNDEDVTPYVYGWASVFWDYSGLASFGNTQQFDVKGNYDVERTGVFKYHLGIGWFAITHTSTLGVSFEFDPDGKSWWTAL